MAAEYSTQHIRILLALYKKQMTKTAFSQRFRALPLNKRYSLLEELITLGLVSSEERPTPGAKHIPVFYFLTTNGQQWVENYLEMLNKHR